MSVVLYSREGWGVCECGHYDWMHDNTIADADKPVKLWGRAEGHGVCGAQVDTIDENGEDSGMRCPCRQYTWVRSEKAGWAKIREENQRSTPKLEAS